MKLADMFQKHGLPFYAKSSDGRYYLFTHFRTVGYSTRFVTEMGDEFLPDNDSLIFLSGNNPEDAPETETKPRPAVTLLERQNYHIDRECAELAEFLKQKNISYDGSFAKDINYSGKTIPAMYTLNVRITDKIRRLQSGGMYVGDNDEEDLLGYLILKRVLKEIQKEQK